MGFTVIEAVALSEFDGLRVPNRYGDLPLHDGDPLRPNDAYFRHVDYVVDRAASLGLVIGLLPTWGDKVGPIKWGVGPEVFTTENAVRYGEFLGERYREKPIIWILGGDRNPDSEQRKAIWRALAAGTLHTGVDDPALVPEPLAPGAQPDVPDGAPLPDDCGV